jgi:predicted permease
MPDWKPWIRKQLAPLKLAPAREEEIADELAQHGDDRYEELIASGAEPAEAHRMVLAELSGHHALARDLRAVERTNAPEPVPLGVKRRGPFFSGLGQDLRYALRTFRKDLTFTSIAVLALAIGIGANTSIFSVVNGVLLRPLSYPEASRLVYIYEKTAEFTQNSVAYPNYLDWRRESRSFTDMGAYTSTDFNLTGSGEPEQVFGAYTTASLFATLGVTPALGRSFSTEDDRPGAACAVMLTWRFWQQRFAADPHVVGKTLTLGAKSCAIAGVLPADFRLQQDARIYMPIEQWNSPELHLRETHPGLHVVGRLKPKVALEAARSEMASISGVLAGRYPKSNAGHSTSIVEMKDDMVSGIRSTLLLLSGAVGFVLIIACANVANLLLARSAARRREFAIRVALGAERRRVIRQLLTESVLLSLAAAGIGIAIAHVGTTLILTAAPDLLPRSGEIVIDPYVLLFALVCSVVTGILFGLAPAFDGANTNPQESLKEGARGAGGGRHRAEGLFVAVEIALAIVLLSGAGLMMQSIWRLWRIDPGFNVRNLLTTQVALSPRALASSQSIRLAYDQILERVRTIPGVSAAAITALVPLGTNDSEIPYWPDNGPQPPKDRLSSALFYLVTPDYLRVMQIPLLQGRFFNAHDTTASTPVVVIDDVMARHVFPGQDPVGKQISMIVIGTAQVIGVVRHVKHWGLDADDTAKVRDQMYFPFLQVPDPFMTEAATGLTLLTRTGPESMSLLSAVRAQVAGPTRDQPVYSVRTMEQIISESLAERRFAMLLLTIFAATALLLAVVGIYGVMSYAVSRRTHEIGIRATLGASRGEILGLVLRQGLRLIAAGIGTGLGAGFLVLRVMAKLLYGVQPADPSTLTAVAVLLSAIALLACYIPARRATSVDPMVALRCE